MRAPPFAASLPAVSSVVNLISAITNFGDHWVRQKAIIQQNKKRELRDRSRCCLSQNLTADGATGASQAQLVLDSGRWLVPYDAVTNGQRRLRMFTI